MENRKDGVDFDITVCDAGGEITEMNNKAGATFGFVISSGRWGFDISFAPSAEMDTRQQAGVSYKF